MLLFFLPPITHPLFRILCFEESKITETNISCVLNCRLLSIDDEITHNFTPPCLADTPLRDVVYPWGVFELPNIQELSLLADL